MYIYGKSADRQVQADNPYDSSEFRNILLEEKKKWLPVAEVNIRD
jgi:hypothetical protein